MKEEKDKKVAIFDLDGTLIDSYEKLTRDFIRMFANLSIRVPKERIKSDWFEISKEYGIPAEDFYRELARRSTWEESLKKGETRLYPDTIPTLKALRSQNIGIRALSRSLPEYVDIKLEYLGIKNYFERVIIVSPECSSKTEGALKVVTPGEKIDRAFFIGDREEDVVVAKYVESQHGIPSLGIYVARDGNSLQGYRNVSSLEGVVEVINGK